MHELTWRARVVYFSWNSISTLLCVSTVSDDSLHRVCWRLQTDPYRLAYSWQKTWQISNECCEASFCVKVFVFMCLDKHVSFFIYSSNVYHSRNLPKQAIISGLQVEHNCDLHSFFGHWFQGGSIIFLNEHVQCGNSYAQVKKFCKAKIVKWKKKTYNDQ